MPCINPTFIAQRPQLYGETRYNTNLVLPPPPDVSAEGELILAEVVLGEHVVELVHRQVDYFVHRDGQP